MVRPQTRRSWCFRAHGGPAVVRLETLNVPWLDDGRLLVKVAASSVNPMDCRLRSGRASKVDFPRILGRDCVGNVVESRSGKFAVGDEVIATNDARSNGTHTEAVAIGNSGVTAWVPLVDHANVGRGTRILIHAGAGVGGNAIRTRTFRQHPGYAVH